MIETTPMVEVQALSVDFSGRSRISGLPRAVHAVRNVDLIIEKGEVLGLVGETGSGKSTVGHAMLRLVRPTTGAIRFDGVDITRWRERALRPLRRRMQIVFQDSYNSLEPRMTVADTIGEPIRAHKLADKTGARTRAHELLQLVGLGSELSSRYPRELSGGQRQRVAIARALSVDPAFIVCDEPTTALDVSIQSQVLTLLAELRERLGLTYLYISHDLTVIRAMSTRVAVMYMGEIVEIGSAEALFNTPGHPYSTTLISAASGVAPRGRERTAPASGVLLSDSSPRGGCHFAPRCWLHQRLGRPEACRVTTPTLSAQSPGHAVACHFASEIREFGAEVGGSRSE